MAKQSTTNDFIKTIISLFHTVIEETLPQNRKFLITILLKSMIRMLPFIEDGMSLLRDIQQFYQIGEMVYVILFYMGSSKCLRRSIRRLEVTWKNRRSMWLLIKPCSRKVRIWEVLCKDGWLLAGRQVFWQLLKNLHMTIHMMNSIKGNINITSPTSDFFIYFIFKHSQRLIHSWGKVHH